jgi:hypothetical protein
MCPWITFVFTTKSDSWMGGIGMSTPSSFPSSLTELVFTVGTLKVSLNNLTQLQKLDVSCTLGSGVTIPWTSISPNLTYLDIHESPLTPLGPFPLLQRYGSTRVSQLAQLPIGLGEKLIHLSFYLPNEVPGRGSKTAHILPNQWPNLRRLDLG